MCQITVSNLGDDLLNRELFLILGAGGSPVHSDGWGYCLPGGEMLKAEIPMYLTTNSGDILKDSVKKNSGVLVGHIRQASPKVPVCKANAHPFKLDNMYFIHNGKLTPFEEENFNIDYTVDETDKTGKKISVAYKRSDSLVFFEHFAKIYKTTEGTGDEKFISAVNKAMDDFYGKFAMVFLIDGKCYIVRGKTAELHISYLLKSPNKDAEKIGWVINTERKNLLAGTILASNLHQLHGKNSLTFTDPDLVPEESIFVAEKTGLRKIGDIKQNAEPAKVYYTGGVASSATNFPSGKNTWSTSATEKELLKYAEEIYKFLSGYSLTLSDLQNILSESWNISILEITEEMTKFFVEKVLPNLKNCTKKDIRKNLRKALGNSSLYLYRYTPEMEYPWFMNELSEQDNLVKKLSGE